MGCKGAASLRLRPWVWRFKKGDCDGQQAQLSRHPSARASVATDQIMQLGLGFWGSKTLLSAIELGVFRELASGPASEEQLRNRLGLHERGCRTSSTPSSRSGCLERGEDGYANTPATDLFLYSAKPTYLGGLLEMANARLYGFWGSLTEALRTGELQNEAKGGGEDLFEALYRDPARLRGLPIGDERDQHRRGARDRQQVPVGALRDSLRRRRSSGRVPVHLALAHPHLTGIGFDLPAVQPIFEEFVAGFGLQERVSFSPGDFFADPLPEADVIVMGSHPPRLGDGRQAEAAAASLRGVARRWRADRVRGDHRRRAPGERLRAA